MAFNLGRICAAVFNNHESSGIECSSLEKNCGVTWDNQHPWDDQHPRSHLILTRRLAAAAGSPSRENLKSREMTSACELFELEPRAYSTHRSEKTISKIDDPCARNFNRCFDCINLIVKSCPMSMTLH